jgi:hypothetical protein
MTRKDYELLAETIATAWWHNSDYKSHFASALADKLENENPRFDRHRFLVACGVMN